MNALVVFQRHSGLWQAELVVELGTRERIGREQQEHERDPHTGSTTRFTLWLQLLPLEHRVVLLLLAEAHVLAELREELLMLRREEVVVEVEDREVSEALR